jgi:thiamine transport system ATP-binding protein
VKLTLENIRKEYGETVALGREDEDRGIGFDVGDGEFFTLVGPSGCGKTTTLRLVAGFDAPTSGTVRFDGREMGGVPPEERGVGVVFQNYALFPHLSVAENVAYGLRFAEPPGGVSRDERVASLLDLVDLPEMGDRDPTELSGGQQQRVALARAIAPGPDLLLLDEPMSALDARLRERLRMQIKEIQSTLGITTLYVTHDQEEALAVSDRVAVMNDGAVEQVGTPQEVYRRPATRFVAEFVGDNNVFEGEVVSIRGQDGENRPASTPGDGRSPVETKGVRSGGDADREGDDRTTQARETSTETGSASPETESASREIEVDIDGARVAIETETSLSSGDRIVFCVRPEAMHLLDDDESDGATRNRPASGVVTNVFDATVSGAEFLGDSTRAYLRWNGRELTVRTTDPPVGEVRVGFAATAAHVLERVDVR